MNMRIMGAAVGAGITSFLLVAVAVIELLNIEFSAIVGLPVGLLAGVAVAVVVAARYDTLAPPVRVAVDGAAGFGFAVVALLAGRYVNLPGFRSELSMRVTIGIAVVVAALVAFASWRATQ